MKALLLTGAAALALWTAPACAQVNDTTAGAAAAQGVRDEQKTSVTEATPGDIVVTAQKRSERLQEVPLAVTVLSGDAITQRGGTNIESAQ